MPGWTSWLSAAGVASLLVAGLAIAETPTQGDLKKGKAITEGAPAVPAEHACKSCHGDTGEGNADSGIPRLSGQAQNYLLRALEEYSNGLRKNEVMTPIAKSLKKEQRQDVTAYYTALKSTEWKKPEAPKADVLRRGEVLASVGSEKIGVQGCMNCHGPQGRGLPPTAPYLAGQPADYLADRLKDWREAKTDDDADPFSIMAQIAHHLRDEDITAVAAWFAQQPPQPIRLEGTTAETAQ